MIECETAARCAEIAHAQQSLVVNAILATVIMILLAKAVTTVPYMGPWR